ncbi:MAG: His-Xaa-Ser system radical SAM maturase HxsB, partial [Parcubacteria group bacterium LiPW_39]
NLSLMDKAKLDWLFKKKVVFCTSLDGPEFLHNNQRVFADGNSYKETVRWLKIIKKKYKTIGYRINALTTITKHSLPFWREIVDTYVKAGLPTIILRFLNPFGLAQKTASQIKYSADEFIDFYKKALDYIIKLNLQSKKIREGYAVITLQKIFGDTDPNFLDLRSPCGAGIGQLAYNFNGDVYTCDEGRMLSRMGDESFKLGNVLKNSYEDLMGHQVVKSCVIASTLEGLPECCHCVYKPYCGTCPVFNYKEQGNIFPQIPTNERCRIFKGIFDYLFLKLQDKKTYDIFKEWWKIQRQNKNV